MSFLSTLFSGAKKITVVDINLVPHDPFFDTILGKALRWALSVGRYIVIFTELVVILSFAARFSLDRQVTDLNDALFQKEQIISSYGDLEPTVRLAQLKLGQFDELSKQSNFTDLFQILSRITPGGIILNELIIRPTTVSLGGRAISQNSLNTFITNIQLTSQFSNVAVERIEIGDNQEPGFEFRISARTQPELPQKSPTTNSSKTAPQTKPK